MSFRVPEMYRQRSGYLASTAADGNNGCFFVKTRPGEPPLQIIASDGMGWEHVSVSRPDRVPNWGEMCRVKSLFWDKTDCVVQYHPPEADYVNNHSRCLHLWRPVGVEIPRPPAFMVGDASLGVIT